MKREEGLDEETERGKKTARSWRKRKRGQRSRKEEERTNKRESQGRGREQDKGIEDRKIVMCCSSEMEGFKKKRHREQDRVTKREKRNRGQGSIGGRNQL